MVSTDFDKLDIMQMVGSNKARFVVSPYLIFRNYFSKILLILSNPSAASLLA